MLAELCTCSPEYLVLCSKGYFCLSLFLCLKNKAGRIEITAICIFFLHPGQMNTYQQWISIHQSLVAFIISRTVYLLNILFQIFIDKYLQKKNIEKWKFSETLKIHVNSFVFYLSKLWFPLRNPRTHSQWRNLILQSLEFLPSKFITSHRLVVKTQIFHTLYVIKFVCP